MSKFKPVLLAFMLAGTSAAVAQEIGANFNHNPEIIRQEYLKKTGVEWIRTTPYIFEYIKGEKDPATEAGLQNIIDAKRSGYKVAFGFRWDFAKNELRVPPPGSSEEKHYFEVAGKIVERVGPYIDIFKLGNEPNLETLKEDLEVNEQGLVPLLGFTERLLTEVVEPYYNNHKELKRPDVYTGSLPRLFDKEQQVTPGVIGLIKMANDNPAIKGLAVHLHIEDSLQMEQSFQFVRSIMPHKPIIIPEYSLFRLYNKHLSDELGDSEKGKAFADKYAYSPSMKLYEWFSKANTERVSPVEWEEMFASRSWFPQHFMLTYYRHFQRHGVVLATYGYFSQSAPAKLGPQSPTWFINPIFAGKSLQANRDGSIRGNPLWYNDFVHIVKEGKRWKLKHNNKG